MLLLKVLLVQIQKKQNIIAIYNNKVTVPSYITSIDISVSFPTLYKAKQNLYSYSYGSSNESESFTKKAGENISIPKRGYSDKVLKIQSAG